MKIHGSKNENAQKKTINIKKHIIQFNSISIGKLRTSEFDIQMEVFDFEIILFFKNGTFISLNFNILHKIFLTV